MVGCRLGPWTQYVSPWLQIWLERRREYKETGEKSQEPGGGRLALPQSKPPAPRGSLRKFHVSPFAVGYPGFRHAPPPPLKMNSQASGLRGRKWNCLWKKLVLDQTLTWAPFFLLGVETRKGRAFLRLRSSREDFSTLWMARGPRPQAWNLVTAWGLSRCWTAPVISCPKGTSKWNPGDVSSKKLHEMFSCALTPVTYLGLSPFYPIRSPLPVRNGCPRAFCCPL